MSLDASTFIKMVFIFLKFAAVVVMATQASQKFVYGGF
jgi:hypothetical protein